MTNISVPNMPTPKWVMVTPAIAEQMLAHNTHNRNVKNQFHQYAEDMRNGDWRPEACDPIRFATDGTLIDGQNRLYAVIEADATIPMLVVRGLPMDAQSVMDTGVSRSFADVLKLNGEDHNITLAAVVRLSWEWGRGLGHLARGRASNSQLLHFLDEHPELREFATSKIRSVADAAYLSSSIVGTLWWVFSRLDDEDADYFFERLGQETGHEKGQPIHELRRTLKSNDDDAKSRRAQRNRVWLMAVTVKAWNAYRTYGADEASVGLYRWKPGGKNPERFPEPK